MIIDSAHKLARHCNSQMHRQNSLLPIAFQSSDDKISVALLDYHDGDFENQLNSVIGCIKQTREFKKSHRVAVISVNLVKEVCREVSIIHDGEKYDCHTIIKAHLEESERERLASDSTLYDLSLNVVIP
ncbi:MAG: hypothetical protein QM538_05500 [Methylacidiphilales bacterium]|nr:hypothetical protein [Candidatus Methylacidiphilales bacterium]